MNLFRIDSILKKTSLASMAFFVFFFGCGNDGFSPFIEYESFTKFHHTSTSKSRLAEFHYQLGLYYSGELYQKNLTPSSGFIEQEVDIHEAIKWLNKSAEQGHPEAKKRLGLLYYTGFGVKKNIPLSYFLTKTSKTTGKEFLLSILESEITGSEVIELNQFIEYLDRQP